MRLPFVMYADFESFNVKISTCEPNPEQSYMQKLQKQLPSSFCFYHVSATGEPFKPVKNTATGDEDIGLIFNETLIEYARMILGKYERKPKTYAINR